MHSHSRRQFIKGVGLTGAASLLAASSAKAAQKESGSRTKAKNIIFLVADGNGVGTMGLAHHWHLRHKGEDLNWTKLLSRSDLRRCLQETASASSPVTDSAAAASAWGCGQRVNNGAINTSPDGKALKPIMQYAKQAGLARGLVTTCRITHATPAGFATSVLSREMESDILEQYLEEEIDVLLGGGARFFRGKDASGVAFDHFKAFEDKGYSVAEDANALAQTKSASKLLGIFSGSHIPYVVDRQNNPALDAVPALETMFEAALSSLEKSEKGFLLQVEAGRVDHAGHANDPAAILHEVLEFDRTIQVAVDYIESHPDTLLVVTSDHGTGGCQLNGLGSKYVDSGPALDRIEVCKASFESLEDAFKVSGQFDPVLFKEKIGIDSTKAQAAEVQALIDADTRYLSSAMTAVFMDELFDLTAVGWTSNNHTSENVELLAFGPGAERIPTYVKNYELFQIMRDCLSI